MELRFGLLQQGWYTPVITEKMIKAGIEAYVANILPYGCIGRADKMVTAIYQAMAAQKK